MKTSIAVSLSCLWAVTGCDDGPSGGGSDAGITGDGATTSDGSFVQTVPEPPDLGPDVPLDDSVVGVIPHGACPSGAARLSIHMDDEDATNGSSHSGWIGATISSNNTTFKFCRVAGVDFNQLSTAAHEHYAVLRLSDSCPVNARKFSRTFDNEDGANSNWAQGSLGPNSSGTSPSKTTLHFCLFGVAPWDETAMSSFPDLGVPYGVFAAEGFVRTLPGGAGGIHTDDEDFFNGNEYDAPNGVLDAARKIVSDGANTTLCTAKVR